MTSHEYNLENKCFLFWQAIKGKQDFLYDFSNVLIEYVTGTARCMLKDIVQGNIIMERIDIR